MVTDLLRVAFQNFRATEVHGAFPLFPNIFREALWIMLGKRFIRVYHYL
jgi:hypothetical protein